MLTYPDRKRFEQIRAQWETLQPSDEGQADMAGWRDKPTPRPPTCVEPHEDGGSKFRRKLSNGFSRIANPLSQRKVTPGRIQLGAPPLAVTESFTTDVIMATSVYDGPVLPAQKSTSFVDLAKKAKGKAGYSDTNGPSDVHITPRPLPRSRTLSFIPLPAKKESNISAADVDGVIKVDLLATTLQPKSESFHSKIPSPSPEVYEHRCYSPRRYLHHHASYNTSPQSSQAATRDDFARVNEAVPANSSQPLEPRTTQNVVKGHNKPQTSGFMAPRKPGPRRSVACSRFEKPVSQENIPADKRVANMRSQIQEGPLKRESLAVAGTLHDRSFGTSTPFMQGRGASFATPQNASKRIISQTSQNTLVTVKRVQRDDRFLTKTPNHPTMKPGPVLTTSLLNKSRASILHEVEPSKQSVLRSCTQADFSSETPGTLQGLGGVSRLTREIGAVNHEVSKLPRSQTFHNFGTQPEDAPPVPPLPVKYRKSFLSDITLQYRMMHDTPIKPFHGRMISDSSLCIVEETSEEMVDHDSTTGPIEAGSAPPRPETPTSLTSNTPNHPKIEIASTPVGTIRSSQETLSESWGCVQEQAMPCVANIAVLQVEDYMPPQYWAGRFQSRYDQWRTDAMNAELNFHSNHQMSSPLSEYKVDQEKLAACYIFAQLRNLCGSDRAADSLWEFEYKYRRDNKLFSNPADLLKIPIMSKREDRTAQGEAETGALARAIKKLTPRKSSLANLMKGKESNKADESKQQNKPEGN